jgi:hypothetical protein
VPTALVVEERLNGPAAQAKSRTLVAVAVVTVRPAAPGASVDVPVAGVSRPVGWSRVTVKFAASV